MDFRLAFVLVAFGFLLFGCHKEDEVIVDEDLEIYLSRFQEEARLRNITIDYRTKPVEARLELHENDITLAWCSFDIKTHNKVTVNTLFWAVLDDLGKEKLVFHELGHCVLNRQHLDIKRDDGRCKSIMHSGSRCSDNYSEETRDAYLDELFLR